MVAASSVSSAAASSFPSYFALLICIIINNNVDRVRSFRHICPLQCFHFSFFIFILYVKIHTVYMLAVADAAEA